MKRQFKEGDIVRKRTLVTSIKKIEDGKATLINNHEVALENLSQVEIYGSDNHRIILVCDIMRTTPIDHVTQQIEFGSISYFDNSVNGKSIISIIEENGFTVVSELQDWLSINAPEYYLRTKLGI